MAAELAAAPRERLADPMVRERYGIDAVTEKIDSLYDTLAARRGRSDRTTGEPVLGTAGAPR
jgi:hypothetical protein